MNSHELSIRLLILQPNAKFSVWELEGDYFGETDPVVRCNHRIDWRDERNCPSEDELMSVSQEQIDVRNNLDYEQALLQRYGEDLQMKMLYKMEKQNHQGDDYSYLQFLKDAQGYDVNN